ncbi:MAG: DMT family transporter [Bacteroidetes bacterium]|nr:MAG: DMT family transporter [Bacteroidota bacterium]
MKNQNKAYIFALLSVLCWSTVATAFKIALKYQDFVQLLLYSSLTSVLILFSILLIQGKLKLLTNQSKKQVTTSLLLGLLNPFLYYLILFKAYSLLPAQMAQPLNYTWGIIVVLFSILILKQKIRLINIIALLVSFSGVIIISSRGEIFNFHIVEPYGVTLAVGSSLIWSYYWILNMKDERDEIVKLFFNFIFGLIFIISYILTFSKFELPNTEGILASVYVGLFEMGITFVFWLKALNYSETTSQVSNIIYLSPFISLVFIYFILGEKILLSSFLGLAFIISGILIQQINYKIIQNNNK